MVGSLTFLLLAVPSVGKRTAARVAAICEDFDVFCPCLDALRPGTFD
jgi:hypothetical protein